MSKEDEFLFYQDLYLTYSARLDEVHRCAANMARHKVKVTSDMVDNAANAIYCDSRSEEEEIINKLHDWVRENDGVCPLFDYRTLSILTGEGEATYLERNVASDVHGLVSKTKGFDISQPWMSNHQVISFDGFYDFQVDFFIEQMKSMAEDALETLRDVGTRLGYMRSYYTRLNEAFNAAPVPELLVKDKHHTNKAPLFSLYWFTYVVDNEYAAGDLLGNMTMMAKLAHPDEGHPPLLTTFGSHVSNRVELIYTESS